jgi:hypothetical protein
LNCTNIFKCFVLYEYSKAIEKNIFLIYQAYVAYCGRGGVGGSNFRDCLQQPKRVTV